MSPCYLVQLFLVCVWVWTIFQLFFLNIHLPAFAKFWRSWSQIHLVLLCRLQQNCFLLCTLYIDPPSAIQLPLPSQDKHKWFKPTDWSIHTHCDHMITLRFCGSKYRCKSTWCMGSNLPLVWSSWWVWGEDKLSTALLSCVGVWDLGKGSHGEVPILFDPVYLCGILLDLFQKFPQCCVTGSGPQLLIGTQNLYHNTHCSVTLPL